MPLCDLSLSSMETARDLSHNMRSKIKNFEWLKVENKNTLPVPFCTFCSTPRQETRHARRQRFRSIAVFTKAVFSSMIYRFLCSQSYVWESIKRKTRCTQGLQSNQYICTLLKEYKWALKNDAKATKNRHFIKMFLHRPAMFKNIRSLW